MTTRHIYLSDVAHDWLRRGASSEHVPMGAWIEKHYSEWVRQRVVIRDSGLLELIEARAKRNETRNSPSAFVRGDLPRLKYSAPALYDGVIWVAMFGAWHRSVRDVRGLSDECIDALASWTKDQGVVQRRAATPTALASQALELFGRGWAQF